jgi:trk system potassium uptake protein
VTPAPRARAPSAHDRAGARSVYFDADQAQAHASASALASFLAVLRILGAVIVTFSFAMLVPLLAAFVGREPSLEAFGQAAAGALMAGMLLWLLAFRARRELAARDGFLLVSLVWTVIPLVACVPLMLYFESTGRPISFTDAYFEAVSGLTTTGATVLSGLDALPSSINLWRCFLQWLGGMGILVLTVAILPLLGVGGSQLFKAEAAGPMKDAKLTPRIAATAKGLWAIYGAISVLCLLAYRLGGMTWMDALMHAFTTMSLGGLSSHDASFAYFKSPVLEWTAVCFMAVASCNFALYFSALRSRSAARMFGDVEFRSTIAALVLGSLTVAAYLVWTRTYQDPGLALRMAFFNVISIASTTGFASTDYAQWPAFAPVLMLMLSGVATSAGSTGAGIKMVRAVILVQQARAELKRILHPSAVTPVLVNGSPVSNSIIHAVLAFMLLYGLTIIVLTMVLMVSGMDVVTALSAVAACVNNTGPGLNEIGPASNFASLSDFQTWVCSLAMVLGRLEIISLLLLFTPWFWRR